MILEGFFRLVRGAGVPRGMAEGGQEENRDTLLLGIKIQNSMSSFETC